VSPEKEECRVMGKAAEKCSAAGTAKEEWRQEWPLP
jgi:hypothetical protein